MNTQVYTEAEYRVLPDTSHRALIVGGTSLAVATAMQLASRGIASAVVDDGTFDVQGLQSAMEQLRGTIHFLSSDLQADTLISQANDRLSGLTTLVNICMPDPTAGYKAIMSYADELLARNVAAARLMGANSGGAIVNHCALPVVYAGSELEDYVSSLRGAVTGVVRTISRKYGRKNVRCVGVQTALLDIPEVHRWASDAVKAVEVPVKRWGSAAECAKLIAFLGLDASYITGQILILDGGLTAGLSGT